MGTKVAPTCATLTLGYLEHRLHQELVTRLGEEDTNTITSNWKIYLDDCFILWNHSSEKLSIFHQLLNDLNPNIKFTLESSDTKLPFLDVLVIKEGTTLSTDIYYKPRNQNLTSLIHQLNNILRQDESTKRIFQDVKFINSKRQPRSLKRILCKSNFNDNNSYTVAKCQDLRCGTCQ